MIDRENPHAPYNHDDHPEKDEFQRRGFAKRIVDTILAQPLGKCLVVSIVGPWGSGKSAVLKYIHDENSSRQASEGTFQIAPFNPWRFAGEDSLLFELMDSLIKAIDPELTILTGWQRIRESLSRFSQPIKQLASVTSDTYLPGSGGITDSMLGSMIRSDYRAKIEEIRATVVQHLEKSDKRIVVLLDDIDRLEADDLMLLLKSIKLIADLPNTTFVIAMDEENVCQVIGSRNGYSPESARKYIEKIVNVRLGLPSIPGHILSDYFIQLANEVIQGFRTKLAPEDAARVRRIYSDLHAPFIRTPRTAKSIQNAFSFELGLLGPEVNAGDLLLLVCTRLLHPHLYQAIQEIIPSLDLGVGKSAERAFEDSAEKEKRQQSIWGELLKDFERLDELRKTTIRKAITHWFPQLPQLSSHEERHDWYLERRICSRSYFWRYFTGAILENDVRDQDVLDWITASLSNQESSTERLKEHLGKAHARAFLAKLQIYCQNPNERHQLVIIDIAKAASQLAYDSELSLRGTIKQRAAEIAANIVDLFVSSHRERVSLAAIDSCPDLNWCFSFRECLQIETLAAMTDPDSNQPNSIDLKMAERSIAAYEANSYPSSTETLANRISTISRNIKYGGLRMALDRLMRNNPEFALHIVTAGSPNRMLDCGDACWTWNKNESLDKVCRLVAPDVLEQALEKHLAEHVYPDIRLRSGRHYYTLIEIGWMCLDELRNRNSVQSAKAG